MASSEVEIVSSAQLGCVLRDQNARKLVYRKKNNSHACTQQNLKDLVHSCFSASPENAADSNMSQGKKADSRGVSSLVKKWRVFEAESQNSYSNSSNYYVYSSCSSRSNSGSTVTDNCHILDGQIRNSFVAESVTEKSEAASEGSCLDLESDRMGPSRDSNSTEQERMKVADIIKKLKCEEANEQGFVNVALPRLRTSVDPLAHDTRGHGAFPATPRIRGRQAYNDLFEYLERDRYQEVQRFGELKAVTNFSHRGRLQAMLKIKLILHEKEVKDGDQINSLASGRRIKNSEGFSVMHLRERFNTGLEQNECSSSPRKEVINNAQDVDKLSSSTQLKEAADHTPKAKSASTSGQHKVVIDYTPSTGCAANPSTPDVDKPSSPSVDNHSTPDVDNPSPGRVDNPPTLDVDNPTSSSMDNPFIPIQLKEVVDHTYSAGNPPTSTQRKEEIHPPEVTHPKSPHKSVVNINSKSTCNIVEDDVNQDLNVVCPTPRSLKDIIHAWEQTHLRSLCKNRNVANETLEVEAWSTSERIKIDISRHDVINPQQNTLELHNTENPFQEVGPNLDVLWQDTTFDTRSYKSQKSDDNATSLGEWKDRNEAEEKVDDEQQDTAFDTRSYKSQKSDDNATSPGEWKDRNEAEEKVDDEQQDTAFDSKSYKSQQSDNNATSPDEWKDRNEDEEKTDNEPSIVSLHELVEDSPLLRIDWEEQPDREKAAETFPDWKSNFSQAASECEEDQYSQNMEESPLDWIYDVCRPRSDWECLRQERYEEMLDPFTGNGDIKQLLERKNVSSFLSSGLRDKIDQLMISRTQGQPLVTEDQVEQVKQEEAVKEEENYAHQKNEQEGTAEYCYEGEEETENSVGIHHSEADEYSNQSPSITSATPDIFNPWSHNQDNNVNVDHVASPSLQQYPSFNSQTFENQHDHEMELISDLRGHMEQLHKEIFDLRKSLHTCMDMQVKLQHFMVRQVESVKSRPNTLTYQNIGTGSIDRIPRKGTCCLCLEAEVDSLLYRCGHMCTCYICAHELQQQSGICPICQAPILDIMNGISFASGECSSNII
ncbi:hypothetical protein ACET3Z_004135 [Daucus carota]